MPTLRQRLAALDHRGGVVSDDNTIALADAWKALALQFERARVILMTFAEAFGFKLPRKTEMPTRSEMHAAYRAKTRRRSRP
jgi:hypothetical protein